MEWISVKEQLPEMPDEKIKEGFVQMQVLVWCDTGRHCAWYQPNAAEFYTCSGWFGQEVNNVTHWMPLPEPPRED